MPHSICQTTASNNPLISVVIPVYNAEKYLDNCISSVMLQTYDNIEVILVNDGSTDRSEDICRDWSKRHSNIKVINKTNEGPSAARNAGVSASSGLLIGFVDADDELSPKMFETLASNLFDTGADVSVCGVAHLSETASRQSPKGVVTTISGKDALRLALEGTGGIWSVARLYPRPILESCPFPVGRTYEDAYITADIYSRTPKVVLDSTPLYFYIVRPGSITESISAKGAVDEIEAFEHLAARTDSVFPELKSQADFRRLWCRFDVLDRLSFADYESDPLLIELEADIARYLKGRKKDILLNPFFSRNRKLIFLLFIANKRIYNKVVRARHSIASH